MIAFRIAALALPPAAAFLASALLAWQPGWKSATIGHAALCAPVLLGGLVAGASGGTILGVLLLSTAFAALGAGLQLAAGQVTAGLVSCLLAASVFFAPAAVSDALALPPEAGEKPEAYARRKVGTAQSRLDFLMSVNPWTVIASSVFELDILRWPRLYRTGMADYVSARPRGWGSAAAGFAVAGIVIGGAGLALRRRLRRSPA